MSITPKGIKIPSTQQIKASIDQVFVKALGPTADTSPNTVIGQISQELTLLWQNMYAEMVQLFNSYSILNAEGLFLDLIAKNFNITRKPGQFTTISVLCTGANGIILPQGMEIEGNKGDRYFLTLPVMIENGTATGIFQAQSYGPFVPSPGTVTKIVSSVSGLDSVRNTSGGNNPGRYVETDAEFRKRIPKEVYATSSSTYTAMMVEIARVSKNFVLLENDSSEPKTIQNVSVSPNTVALISQDGSDIDLANALYRSKAVGINTQGDVSVAMPSTIIRFSRPQEVTVTFSVTIKISLSEQPPNVVKLIKDTILDFMSHSSKVGGVLYSSEIITVLALVGVKYIQVLTLNGQNYLSAFANQYFVTTQNDITVQEVE